MLGTPSITLEDNRPASNASHEPLYFPLKYGIHAVPQALYIGNYTVVLCVGPRLRDEMHRLRRELRCRGPSSWLLREPEAHTPPPKFNEHHHGAASHSARSPSAADERRYSLSPSACADVRRWYEVDTLLRRRLCASAQATSASGTAQLYGARGSVRLA